VDLPYLVQNASVGQGNPEIASLISSTRLSSPRTLPITKDFNTLSQQVIVKDLTSLEKIYTTSASMLVYL
jgi:hypothetical protein